MQTGCIHCGQQHLLKDGVVGKHTKVQFRCTRCGQITIVELQRRPDETVVISPMPSFARADSSTVSLKLPPASDDLRLPTNANVTLRVEGGPDKGTVFTLKKARTVIGRKGSDFALSDPEISRHHCLLEVRDSFVNLKDLDSTNGTFFEEERVRAAFLQDEAEFRVGSSVIRLKFQPKD